MNQHTGTKTSTAIKLSDKEMGMLEDAQEAGISRGITLLSQMTFSKKQMAIDALTTSVSIATTSIDFSKGEDNDDTVGSLIGDGAEAKINTLLSKCWDKARAKVANNKWLSRASHVLEVGLNQLISWIKGLIFSGKVLAQVVPFYGNIKGIVDGALIAIETHGHRSSFESLVEMGDKVSSGISSAALDAFSKYARAEMIRCAGKSAWTFAKSIGGLLAEIFSFGAWKVVDFVIAIVEAITSFCFSVVQAVLFDKATKKFGDYATARTLPSADEFRTIVSGCSFVGCVYFAAANYIGHFNISSMLSNSSRVLSTKSLTDGLTKINEAQKMACGYASSSHFKISFRDAAAKEEFGWVLDMIEGYSSSAPKSEFLTKNATRWQRFKHKAKKLKRKLS